MIPDPPIIFAHYNQKGEKDPKSNDFLAGDTINSLLTKSKKIEALTETEEGHPAGLI